MKQTKLSLLAAAPLLLALFGSAQATTTGVVLNLEGNPTCSSLGLNSQILEYRDSSPLGESTVDIPTPGGVQTLYYNVEEPTGANARVVRWEITHVNGVADFDPADVYAMNYVILKAQGGGGARVFHFGATETSPGAITDEDEEATGTRMAAVSFCYGLTQGLADPEPPSSFTQIPNCDDLASQIGAPGDLFGVGIVCPDNIDRELLLINMDLNADNFGFDADTIRACTCNTSLPPCNPDLPVVPSGSQDPNLPDSQRSCLEASFNDSNGDGFPDGVNTRVPLQIEGVENPDSYVCYVIGGTRYCYGHF